MESWSKGISRDSSVLNGAFTVTLNFSVKHFCGSLTWKELELVELTVMLLLV